MKAPITAKELIEFAAPQAAEMFEKCGELRPLWHVVSASGEQGIIAAPLGARWEKDIVAAALREVFKQLDAVACIFMCESWMVLETAPNAIKVEDLDAIRRDGIDEHPDRLECLWFAAEDAEGEITAYQLIERPDGPEGRGVLQPLKMLNRLARVEGRFVGMLPTRGKGH